MSNVYSLDTLKADLDKEFAPLQLELGGETLTLRNLMRINDSDRNKVMTALDSLDFQEPEKNEDGSDKPEDQEHSAEEIAEMGAALTTVFLAITAQGKGQKLVDYVDGDIPLSMKILELWTEATQPGEAQNSPA